MLKLLKKHWILFLSLLLLVLLVIPLLYFGTLFKMLDNRVGNQANLRANSVPVMGICLNNLLESRSLREKEVFLSEAKSEKISLQIRVAHHSLARQIHQIRSLIRENVKSLIIAPVSKKGLAEVLQEAAKKGVKIVLYDELTDGPADLYCGVDYREIGRMQASYLVKTVGRGHYLVLKGPNNSYKANQIAQGQSEALKKMSKIGVRVLTEEAPPQWAPVEVALKTRTLTMHQKINAILTPNDICAEEIIKLFVKQGQQLPYIGGVGGERTALRRIITGEQLVTVASDYDTLAKTGFHDALKLALGERVLVSESIVYNSRKIPAVFVPTILINQANVDQQIKNQYQFLEE